VSESLATVTDRLYGLDPADFLPARTDAVKAARQAKDRELAAAIGALRKPTRSAWLINLLHRHAPNELAALMELADALAEAQQSLSGPQLRSLTTQRNRVIDSLVRRAQALGAERGYAATEAVRTEVSATLSAALADPAARADVEQGVCTTALSYGGFGLGLGQDTARPALRVVPGGKGADGADRSSRASRSGRTAAAPADPGPADAAALLARIEEAQARIATLTSALAEGERHLSDTAAAEEHAHADATAAAEEAERLRAALLDAEHQRDDFAAAAASAKLATAAARAARDEQAVAFAEARQALADLVAAAQR